MTPTGLTIPDGSGLPLSAASIRQSIAKAVSEVIPEGRTGAAVGIVSADGSLHLVLASKIGDNWTVAGSLDRDGKHVSGQVMVAGSWGG